MCLDSDNILHKASFLKLLSAINDDDSMASFAQMDFFLKVLNLRVNYRRWFFLKEYMEFSDFRKTSAHPVAGGNYIFTKELFDKVGGYEIDLGALDAYSLGYKALNLGYKMKLVPGAKYYHRLSLDSYWIRENSKNSNNLKRLLLRFPDNFTKDELSRIESSDDPNTILISLENDFSVIKQNHLFDILAHIKKGVATLHRK
jgi:GT2 family glycosyltransferase